PSDADRQAILTPLQAYNRETTSWPRPPQTFALLVRDEASGDALGGLWARAAFGWLFVELLFVPESLRGQGVGSRLLAQAEDLARQNGCVGVWLDTFSFQAPDFYRKNGYETFGVIDDYPGAEKRFFLRKRLDASPSAARETV
ncbi:MAG: GNAT family N-acetyltransferase, partial [Hyphomicrobiales bacterium]|nr:GNAT family N-acetyltransferase [Hyphomicrobiales bacterium]